MAENLQQFIDTLKEQLRKERAENARLQEHADIATETSLQVIKERDALQARVEEAERKWNLTVRRLKALAERRKKALVHMTAYTEEWHPVTEDGCMVDEDIEEAHAAIESAIASNLDPYWWKCNHCGKEYRQPETLREQIDRQRRQGATS